MNRLLRFFLFLLTVTAMFILPAAASEWLDVKPGHSASMPGDLYFKKNYRVQWWYMTGHLFDASGREFGYELTFFAAGAQRRAFESKFGVDFIYLSHFAVSDVSGNRFYHFADVDSGAYGFAGADGERLRVWVDKSSVQGSLKKMQIKAGSDYIDLDLSLVPKKPVVLHGDRGYSRKSEASPLIASLYFSFTRMETTGVLKIRGDTFQVTGESWFDREISSRGLAESEAGWDWFALQLEDEREIMLYDIRNKDGTLDAFSSGTTVYKNGTYRRLEKKDFSVNILDHYTSAHTGARYPSRWEVSIPSENIRVVITPLVKDQEFTAAGAIRKTYWEGTCRVEGSAKGRAYVEMTGY